MTSQSFPKHEDSCFYLRSSPREQPVIKPIYKPKEICNVLQKTYQYITSQHAKMLVGDPEFINYVSTKQLRNNNETPISINFIRIYLAKCAACANKIVLGSAGLILSHQQSSSFWLFGRIREQSFDQASLAPIPSV